MLNKNNPPTPPFAKGGLGGITDKNGLTLIEVLIAALITLILFLALMQTALLSISVNTGNVLRDEAVSIAEMRMRELRSLPFNSLTAGVVIEPDITRDFRNFTHPFTPTVTITDLNIDNKRIDITITWEWKEKTVANGNPYTHIISTIVRRP